MSGEAEHHLESVLHEPYGLEHPYEQGPTERVPCDPVAGQAVALGAATSPAGAARAVWASWEVEGEDASCEAPGQWLKDDAERSYWRVQLPAFPAGRRVTYRLHARQGNRQLKTEDFTSVVAAWQAAGDVARLALARDGLQLECAGGGLTARVHVTIRCPAPHVLHVRLAVLRTGASAMPCMKAQVADTSSGTDAATSDARQSAAFEGFEETDERIVMSAPDLQLTIDRSPFRVRVIAADGRALLAQSGPLEFQVGQGGRALRVRQAFASPPEEAFYGFGERYNALDQRGNKLDVRVFDQFTNQGRRTYLPVPFCHSSLGYGLYLATPRNVTYDLAASRPDQWCFDAELGPDEALDYYILTGQPGHIMASFADLTGKPALPPTWAFGPWMSGNEWNSQAVVMEQVRLTTEHDIPATVLVIEAWSDESTFYIWNDAVYAPRPPEQSFTYSDFSFPTRGRWPDPKGMIDALHGRGLRVVLWQIPVMKKLEGPHPQHDADEAYMFKKGYCVREADGRPYRVRPFWFHDGLLLDVTNPEAMEWWLSKRAYLLEELGVDGFKTDGGEHLWGRGQRFASGQRSDELYNTYSNLYIGAYHHFARQKRAGDAITFSRAGFTGAQAFPCHWAGDENSTWAAFRASILAGLSAGLSGIPFWGWDLAGFTGEIPSAELYMRAAAMAAFCPIMQYHSDFNHHGQPCRDRTPWNVASRTGEPRVIEVFRAFAQLRMRLLPYIEAEARHCCASGEPLMRPLFLDWPSDQQAWRIDDQYCFGRALLVAPVLQPGLAERRLYLPAGEWADFWTGTRLEGGVWITRAVPLDVIPVYRRLAAAWPL